MGNELQDGIGIDTMSSNIYIHREGVQLNFNVQITISDEDDDVAMEDASNMQAILTAMIRDFVKDYAADGQEVD